MIYLYLTETWRNSRPNSSQYCLRATMRAMVDVEVDDSKLTSSKTSEIDKLWSSTQKGSVKRSKRVSPIKF